MALLLRPAKGRNFLIMSIQTYDAMIVGTGQAGGPLSTALANAGRKTALIERVHVGGTCINEGCTPTKTMIASGRVAYLTRRAADYGVANGSFTIDMVKVRQRKRDIVTSFRDGSQRRIESTTGVDLLFGEARFIGSHTLEAHLTSGEHMQLAAPEIFINAGARPSRPRIPRLDEVPTLDSTSIMELDAVPEHLLVLGGGYVGLEFGQLFRRLGSQVTIIQRGTRLLTREDDDVADAVTAILREDGIQVLLETTPLQAAREADLSIRRPSFMAAFAGFEKTPRGALPALLLDTHPDRTYVALRTKQYESAIWEQESKRLVWAPHHAIALAWLKQGTQIAGLFETEDSTFEFRLFSWPEKQVLQTCSVVQPER